MNNACPQCGNLIRDGARFCAQCGFDMAPVRSQPVSGAAGSAPSAPAYPSASHIGTQRLTSPRLIIRIQGQQDQEVPLVGGKVTIGRDLGNQVVVPLPDVSRHHAEVLAHNSGYAVIDLGSANGTHLRGKRIPERQLVELQNGDVIRVGDRSGNSISITYQAVEQPAAAVGKVDLNLAALGSLPIFTIGRDPQSNLPIQSPVVSWHHAEVIKTPTGHQLNDLGSTNGTFVNAQRVRSVQLSPGDEVQIGPFKLVYSPGGFQQHSSVGNIRLDGVRLRKEVPVKVDQDHPYGTKVILNDVSLTVMPREFVALVGGSGAGKSTLIDALNGFRRVTTGKVLINGDDLYGNYDAYRSGLGYVPQSDILHIGLPVSRALRYIAMLRLPPDTTRDVIAQRTVGALQQVEMSAQVNQPIHSLSGGQRKRVSIASELLSDPSLFFLDEPTSGLDPGLDKKMMSTLRLLADGGHTILLTTHATSNILGQCDLVAFLSFGRLVFYGPPDQAIQFFNVTDFADIYSKLDSPEEAEQWEAVFKNSPEYHQYVVGRQSNLVQQITQAARARVQPPKMSVSAMLRQLSILSRRYLDLIFNDRMSMFILLAVMPIIGLLMLMIADDNSLVGDTPDQISYLLTMKNFYSIVGEAQKLLNIMALSVILLGVFAASYEIVKEKAIYRRERMVNLRIWPYLLSKGFVLFGFGLLQVAALMAVVGLKVEIPSKGVILPAWLEMYISLVLAMSVGIALGLLISAAVKNSNMVIYLVLVVLFVQLIFSGVMFEIPAFARWLSYGTSNRWALEGLGATVNMDELNKLGQTRVEFEVQVGAPSEKIISSQMDFNINYDHTTEHLLITWGVQLLSVVLLFIITALVLRTQDKQT